MFGWMRHPWIATFIGIAVIWWGVTHPAMAGADISKLAGVIEEVFNGIGQLISSI